MTKKIIKIDRDKCIGCELCVSACRGGAIGMVDGKAKLLHENYCDGLGNCLPVCPTGAISFEHKQQKPVQQKHEASCGCPNVETGIIRHEGQQQHIPPVASRLNQWPVQIKLVPHNAPFFNGANLLIAADCAAYAYGNFHAEYMQHSITLIGCPKLDQGDYTEKLTAILSANDIKTVSVARMEVPCCSGIQNAVKTAVENCGKDIELRVIVISIDGKIDEK